MMRILLLIFLSFATACAAEAEDYTNQKAGFRVTIPKGWTKTIDPVEPDNVIVTSPDAKKTFGFCDVHSLAFPGTETLSQSEIDQRLTGKLTPSYWRSSFTEMGFKDVVLEASGEEVQNGRNTYYAIVNFLDIRRRFKVKVVAHFVPGRMHHVYCTAYLEAYAREETDFETFFDSFTPLDSDLVASRVPGQPSITASNMPKNTLQLGWLHRKTIESLHAMKALVQGAAGDDSAN